MKSLHTTINLIALATLSLASSAAVAQNWSPPTKLAGSWSSTEYRDNTKLSVTLDTPANAGRLSVDFPEHRCNIRGAPMTVASLGGRIVLKSTDAWASLCVTEMTLEMVPNPGPKGEMGYRGELRLAGSAANRTPILRGRLTAP